TVHGGKYRIKRKLGQGGFGTVFIAEHVDDYGPPLAVKVLDLDLEAGGGEMKKRFEEEARTLNKLRKDGVRGLVEIRDFGVLEDGRPYIAMELVPGRTLQEMLKASGALEWQTAVEIARRIAETMLAVHQSGVVHRDLKPGNIMIDEQIEDLEPKILDF